MREGDFNRWKKTREKGAIAYIIKNTSALALAVFILDFLLSRNAEVRGFPNWDMIIILSVLNAVYFFFAWKRTEKKYEKALEKLTTKENKD